MRNGWPKDMFKVSSIYERWGTKPYGRKGKRVMFGP